MKKKHFLFWFHLDIPHFSIIVAEIKRSPRWIPNIRTVKRKVLEMSEKKETCVKWDMSKKWEEV